MFSTFPALSRPLFSAGGGRRSGAVAELQLATTNDVAAAAVLLLLLSVLDFPKPRQSHFCIAGLPVVVDVGSTKPACSAVSLIQARPQAGLPSGGREVRPLLDCSCGCGSGRGVISQTKMTAFCFLN